MKGVRRYIKKKAGLNVTSEAITEAANIIKITLEKTKWAVSKLLQT